MQKCLLFSKPHKQYSGDIYCMGIKGEMFKQGDEI